MPLACMPLACMPLACMPLACMPLACMPLACMPLACMHLAGISPACTLPATRQHLAARAFVSVASHMPVLTSSPPPPPPSPPSPRGDLKSSSASAVSLDCASAGGVPAHAATLTRVDQLNSLMATTLGGTVGRLVSGIYDATNSMGRSFVGIKDPPTSSLAVRDGK